MTKLINENEIPWIPCFSNEKDSVVLCFGDSITKANRKFQCTHGFYTRVLSHAPKNGELEIKIFKESHFQISKFAFLFGDSLDEKGAN